MKNLNSKTITLASLLVIAVGTFGVSQAQNPSAVGEYTGTYRLASLNAGGDGPTLSPTTATLKHITPTQFTWLSYNKETGAVTRVGGGTYTRVGQTLKENVQYGLGSSY